MIVDDDPRSYLGLPLLLHRAGYVVELAESAAQAFRMVGENPPDLVLTDLQIPEADGVALCRALHVHRPELPVIVLTGFSDSSSVVRALHAGAEDYLVKPVDFQELLVSIQDALGRDEAGIEQQRVAPPVGRSSRP